jgi:signal transduction histidine kinase
MRRRVVLLVVATSSAIVVAFVVPLALLLRNVAEDRAVTASTQEAQSLAVLAAAVSEPAEIERLVALVDERSPRLTTVVLPDGTVIGEPAGNDADLDRARSGEAFTVVADDHAAVYAPAVTSAGTAVVRSVVTAGDLHRGVTRAVLTVGLLAVLLLAAAVLAADRVALWISRPVRELAVAADSLRGGELGTRVAETGPPEVVASARALNRLAARISELLVAERDSVANLSHRLRTPVTALRLDAEALPTSADSDRLRDHVAVLERTIDAIVHDARRPSRTTVGAHCDAADVVRRRMAFWAPLAEDQGRRVDVDVPVGPVLVALEADDLSDVVDVLVDNVFAYTPEGTPFSVQLDDDGPVVGLSVSDEGPGMPTGDPVARGTSGAGSSGLGLDIARRASAASGGGLVVGRSPRGGAVVTVRLGPVG